MATLLGGFFSATAFRPFYEGTLSDVELATGATRSFDGNLIAFSVLAIVLAVGILLARRPAV
jgi:hypothetical protein